MCILVVGCGCVAVEVMGAALFFLVVATGQQYHLKPLMWKYVGLRVD